MVNIHHINSLIRPRFTSFVAIPRTVNTSTTISTIMSLIALVGVMLVYISSRRKKCSMRLKLSISFPWLALASLAAWVQCQNKSHDRKMQENRPKEERRSLRRLHWLVGMPVNKCQGRNSPRRNVLIFTSPTPWPMVPENEYKTFTVGVTHFVSPSSQL
jgi:hypothetical protein